MSTVNKCLVQNMERLATKLRGIMGGVAGSMCFNVTVDRKSTTAAVELAFRDVCNSWTWGNSSDIRSITVSKGKLSFWQVNINPAISRVNLLPLLP
jgi:hypothetical protein